jgi:hypothetical protein
MEATLCFQLLRRLVVVAVVFLALTALLVDQAVALVVLLHKLAARHPQQVRATQVEIPLVAERLVLAVQAAVVQAQLEHQGLLA